jgi:hypothetical protein
MRSWGHTGKPHQAHQSLHSFTPDRLATPPQKSLHPASTKKWSLSALLIDQLTNPQILFIYYLRTLLSV